ncbi:MAG: ribonuclease PH [Planctomycetota bacterium]
MKRIDGRNFDALREIRVTRDFVPSAPGSVLIEWGRTRVICTATVEDRVPPFLVNTGRGWLSAEYGMLPGSTDRRKPRDGRRGPIDGRTVEIQRLVGRNLRNLVRLDRIGPRTIWIDCDVVEADGGTRTASINGAWIALADCLEDLRERKLIKADALVGGVAAVSVGIIEGAPYLDLCYEEDARAEADVNFVMTHDGRLVEIQGGAEGRPLEKAQFDACWDLAAGAVPRIAEIQHRTREGERFA